MAPDSGNTFGTETNKDQYTNHCIGEILRALYTVNKRGRELGLPGVRVRAKRQPFLTLVSREKEPL